MAHRIISTGISVIILCLLFTSVLMVPGGCYYDNEEELYPNITGCDTVNITYSGSVAPIMANRCNTCHSGSAPSAGIRTDNYNDLSVLANNGRLWGVVNHAQGYSPMPKDQAKLSDCDLTKIRKWIDAGFLEN